MDWLIFPTQSSLRYLDGSMPGDYGFDPLGLFDPASGGAGAMSQVGGCSWLEVAGWRWVDPLELFDSEGPPASAVGLRAGGRIGWLVRVGYP